MNEMNETNKTCSYTGSYNCSYDMINASLNHVRQHAMRMLTGDDLDSEKGVIWHRCIEDMDGALAYIAKIAAESPYETDVEVIAKNSRHLVTILLAMRRFHEKVLHDAEVTESVISAIESYRVNDVLSTMVLQLMPTPEAKA